MRPFRAGFARPVLLEEGLLSMDDAENVSASAQSVRRTFSNPLSVLHVR